MLTEGVPENTIAIIDDSGGTLTAPILGDFTAVVCLGGTVRSHLGILTREYNVPCLMNATLDGLADGDEVTVEYSKPAADAYADADAGGRPPRPHHQGLLEGNRCRPSTATSTCWRPTTTSRRRRTRSTSSAPRAPCRSRNSSRSTRTSRCRTTTPGSAGPELLRKVDAAMPAEEIGDRARQVGTYVNTITMDVGPAVLPRRPPDAARHGAAEADRRGRRRDRTCSTSRAG